MSTATAVARSWGRVMCRKVCQPGLAPSIVRGLVELLGDLLQGGDEQDHVEADLEPQPQR